MADLGVEELMAARALMDGIMRDLEIRGTGAVFRGHVLKFGGLGEDGVDLAADAGACVAEGGADDFVVVDAVASFGRVGAAFGLVELGKGGEGEEIWVCEGVGVELVAV